MWTSEERKIIKKIGFKLNHLGEWNLALPSDIGHIIINRIDGKIVLTLWNRDKYKEWKPNNIDKAKDRIDDIVQKTKQDIDAKNNIYHFTIINTDEKAALIKLFNDIKELFPNIIIRTVPKLVLLQIITQFRAQYDSNSVPINIKIDLTDLLTKK
jgi:hypothetical protein